MATAVRTERKKADRTEDGTKAKHNIGKVVQVIGPSATADLNLAPAGSTALSLRVAAGVDTAVGVTPMLGRRRERRRLGRPFP